MSEFRHGALAVVEQAPRWDQLLRDLKRLDSRLFFERQMTLAGDTVWCVCIEMGVAEPPATILEWRDENLIPLDLDSGVIERVRKMMATGDAAKLGRDVIEKNRLLIERRRAEMREAIREMTLEALPSILGQRSVNLPRGVSLRMARDKRRARGEKV